MSEIETTVVWSKEITPDDLPTGVYWDEDGAAWRATKTTAGVDDDRDWWRWAPVNVKALAKGTPDKPVSDVNFSGLKSQFGYPVNSVSQNPTRKPEPPK